MPERSDIRDKVLTLLARKPVSVSELCRILNLRRDFVTGYLEAMRHRGDLKFVTIGRSKVYMPSDKKK